MNAWLGFERRVAVRFLREGRMQTLLIIVGVAAGVAVVAYISALISGLQANTLNKTLGAQAHVSISPLDDVVLPARDTVQGSTAVLDQTQPRAQRPRSLANWQALLPLLEALPEVAAVSPMVAGAGLALRGEAQKSISLLGVELDRYDRIVNLRTKVVAGVARLGPGEAVIGFELARDLGLRVGDRFSIQTGGVTDSARVTALVDLGCVNSTAARWWCRCARRKAWSACLAASPTWTWPCWTSGPPSNWPTAWASAGPSRWKAGRKPTPAWWPPSTPKASAPV